MLACEITFYGKPKCVTNRKQVSMLRKAGIRVNEVNVLEHPWSPGELKPFLQGRAVENWLNPSAPAVKDGRFSLRQPEDVILQALCDEPILIRRPLIEFETPNEPVRLSGFDPQRLTDLLGVTIETGLSDMEACSLTTSAQSVEQRNLDSFQLILTSQKQGKTSLPRLLGLSEMDFIEIQTQLSGTFGGSQSPVVNTHETDLRQELLNCRQDEFMELQALLLKFRANRIAEHEQWFSAIISAGCLGANHLWQDLGLPDRKRLTDLITDNFPDLAKANSKNMKWKRFFYKQLCELGGGYVCRAPTCEQCVDYQACFGPE